MFEFHGWATLRDTAGTEDWDPDPSDATVERVRELLAAAPADFGEIFHLSVANGDWHVWFQGFRNHRQQWVIELFREIAEIAPGSYGLLHVHDDEAPGDDNNAWICWTMRRGAVSASVEQRLTPFIGLVEDEWHEPGD